MKHFKIFVSLMLVCMMMLAVVTTASAVDEPSTVDEQTGTITISNARTGAEYSVYKILRLDSFDPDLDAYKYKAEPQWEEFFNDNSIAKMFFTYDAETKIVALKKEINEPTASQLQSFAKEALDYANSNNIAATKTETAPVVTGSETTELKFTELPLGYYLVTSSIGTVLSLNTTHPDVTISDKNPTTELTKTVNNQNVDIGDTVTFYINIKLQADASNEAASKEGFLGEVIIHDIMDSSLTLDELSFAGTKTTSAGGSSPLSNTDFTVITEPLEGEADDSKCTFHVKLTGGKFKAGETVQIRYKAVLNEHAVIGEVGNKNEAYATYGGHTTPPSEVKVYTGKLIIDKVAKGTNAKLKGATFYLKNEEGNFYKYVPLDSAVAAESNESDVLSGLVSSTEGIVSNVEWVSSMQDATLIVTDDNGQAVFAGIKAGKYELVEKDAPAGFNKLLHNIAVTIPGSDDTTGVAKFVYTATVENETGVLLPETGGIGTTLFIVFGSIAVIAAGVILVARRRMKLMVD